MSVNRSHHVLHRMVPLICQALTCSSDETVWLDGLRLLASPKLRTALSITASIWLPLLLKGLDVSRSSSVNTAALHLLGEVADQLKPMKSCLAKPLKALARDPIISTTGELLAVSLKLDMSISPGGGAVVAGEAPERRATRSIGVSSRNLAATQLC
jgi:FKBP12-rapamycin complex-associated protein